VADPARPDPAAPAPPASAPNSGTPTAWSANTRPTVAARTAFEYRSPKASIQRSARGLRACASWARRTIWAGVESAAPDRASTTMAPSWLAAPPGRRSPAPTANGRASPVTCSVLTSARPCTTVPSTGSRCPGRTRHRSPRATRAAGTSRSDRRSGPPPEGSRSTSVAAAGVEPSSAARSPRAVAEMRSSRRWAAAKRARSRAPSAGAPRYTVPRAARVMRTCTSIRSDASPRRSSGTADADRMPHEPASAARPRAPRPAASRARCAARSPPAAATAGTEWLTAEASSSAPARASAPRTARYTALPSSPRSALQHPVCPCPWLPCPWLPCPCACPWLPCPWLPCSCACPWLPWPWLP